MISFDCLPNFFIVKVEYPLKQGLKLLYYFHCFSSPVVKVEYPLKQGLKPQGVINTEYGLIES